ncbi:MAG: hypothetical protein HW389_208 [Bacteroidetes bacterium]|nr:hypothetical protein [Bacteroidota bacterium]
MCSKIACVAPEVADCYDDSSIILSKPRHRTDSSMAYGSGPLTGHCHNAFIRPHMLPAPSCRNHRKLRRAALNPVVRQLHCRTQLMREFHSRILLKALIFSSNAPVAETAACRAPRQTRQDSWSLTPAWAFFDSITVEEQQAG